MKTPEATNSSCVSDQENPRENQPEILLKHAAIPAQPCFIPFCDRKWTKSCHNPQKPFAHWAHHWWKVSRGKNHIDGELVSFIRNLTVLNKKANDIIVEVADWSSSRGHNNPGDRRFYPTPEDIKYIMKTFRDEGWADRSDVASIDRNSDHLK